MTRSIAWAVFGPILAIAVAAIFGCMVLRAWVSDLADGGRMEK